MGVDHGLGGRDNKKSREKREKRFKKKENKAKLLTSLPAKKREVVFNEDSRVDYLTGFRQRKKERRQYGIAMQVLKDKKTLRDKRPKLGKLLAETENVKEKEVQFDDSENEGDGPEQLVKKKKSTGENSVTDGANNEEHEVNFTDENTTSMFGGEVSVTVDTNIADQLDEASYVFSGNAQNLKKAPTALEKAMKKAKNIMHLKVINKNKHVYIKKNDDKKGDDKNKKGRGKVGANKKKSSRR